MHLQENLTFDHCPGLFTSFDLCTCKVKSWNVIRFRKKIHYLSFKLDLWVAQYPLHHVTYSGTKFEVATSNSLQGDAFTRKNINDLLPWGQGHKQCCPVPSTSCDLFRYKVWSSYVWGFRRRCIYKKIHSLTFDLDLWVNVTWNVGQYPVQSLKLLPLAVSEKVHLQEKMFFDLDLHMKSCPVPSTSCDLSRFKVWSCYV